VTFQGAVLDGRNRLRACEELGVTPRFVEWDGVGSPLEFVAAENLYRRHLTPGQRAAIAAEVLALMPDGRSKRGAVVNGRQVPADHRAAVARSAGCGASTVGMAAAVLKADPVLHGRVKSGEITLPQATRQVHRERKRADLLVKAAAVPPRAAGVSPWEVTAGDCLDVMASLPAGCARLVFADPPYNQGVDYGGGPAADRLPDAAYARWAGAWLSAASRLLTADGSLWVLISTEWAPRYLFPLREAGLHLRRGIVWYETFGVNTPGNFNLCHRHLLYAVKDPERFVFHADAVNRESARQRQGDARADPGGKTWDSVWGVAPPIPRLVGTSKERLPDFPTQLPVALLRPIVGCASDPGDLVVDPFSGSGTSGHACLELGRRYHGIEKNPHFAGLSRARLASFEGLSDADPSSGACGLRG
jgi:DNA modification methylase